jgi:hypothetical protein
VLDATPATAAIERAEVESRVEPLFAEVRQPCAETDDEPLARIELISGDCAARG